MADAQAMTQRVSRRLRRERVFNWAKAKNIGLQRQFTQVIMNRIPSIFSLSLLMRFDYFSWGELCDKCNKPNEKIGDYAVATIQGKPPQAAAAEITGTTTARKPAVLPKPLPSPACRHLPRYPLGGQVARAETLPDMLASVF